MTKDELYSLAVKGCKHAARLYARLKLRLLKRSAAECRKHPADWRPAFAQCALFHWDAVQYFAALSDCPRLVRSASASLSRAGIRHSSSK